MSSYSDFYKDTKQAEFMERWAPLDAMPDLTDSNLRWNVARANAAQSELRELKTALRTLKDALR
jgi:hypothetical protein